MREKLKSLPLTELKQIAKENHIKNVSTLRKAQLIDVILERLSPVSYTHLTLPTKLEV